MAGLPTPFMQFLIMSGVVALWGSSSVLVRPRLNSGSHLQTIVFKGVASTTHHGGMLVCPNTLIISLRHSIGAIPFWRRWKHDSDILLVKKHFS